MTPFFVLSVFLTMTQEVQKKDKNSLAIKVTIAVVISSLVLLFFGKYIFAVFGITLDAFRIGAGALLFLTAVELVKGTKNKQEVSDKNIHDIAVVPLAIPIVIGPGTIGVLLVMGAEFDTLSKLTLGSFALVLAVITIGLMLYLSSYIEKVLGEQGLLVISKVTGLFVAALSAQIIFTGVKNILNLG
jgi:multiple antibiotic resistance protein